MSNQESNTHAILGQKYAYATASLVLGILCFVNFAGMEKAIVAIIFAWLALKSTPPPRRTLTLYRQYAQIDRRLADLNCRSEWFARDPSQSREDRLVTLPAVQ